jgi:hypothetical protein
VDGQGPGILAAGGSKAQGELKKYFSFLKLTNLRNSIGTWFFDFF